MRRKYTVILVLVVIIALVVFWYEEHKTEQSVYKKELSAAPVKAVKA